MTFQIIYPKQLKSLMEHRDTVLVDIRSKEEYARGHYPGAVNWYLEAMPDYERRFRKNRFYILYCEHGGSSLQFARELGQKGYRMGSVLGGWESMREL